MTTPPQAYFINDDVQLGTIPLEDLIVGDCAEAAAIEAIPQSEIVGGHYVSPSGRNEWADTCMAVGGGGGGGGGWNNQWTTYTCATNTVTYSGSATSGTYTLTYNGEVTAPIPYNNVPLGIIDGGGTSANTDYYVYVGGNNTTFHLYNPPNVFPDELVNQPLTQEQATREWLRVEIYEQERETREWLAAERQYYNEWLTAERYHRETEYQQGREAAKARALALLMSMLSEPQKERYTLRGDFEVIGSHGGRYVINRGVAGNIRWLTPEGDLGNSLCCHPETYDGIGHMPPEDVMLGQMLALSTDEVSFVRTANGRKPPHLAGVI